MKYGPLAEKLNAAPATYGQLTVGGRALHNVQMEVEQSSLDYKDTLTSPSMHEKMTQSPPNCVHWLLA